ncbi:MAG: hypothetical protein ACRD1T_13120, partial [Acidimicrobiia bacterium]
PGAGRCGIPSVSGMRGGLGHRADADVTGYKSGATHYPGHITAIPTVTVCATALAPAATRSKVRPPQRRHL